MCGSEACAAGRDFDSLLTASNLHLEWHELFHPVRYLGQLLHSWACRVIGCHKTDP